MKRCLAALLVIAASVVASTASAADLDGKLTCSGTTCTFTVTNKTGKAQLALQMIWSSGAKLTKVTDPQARPTTYFNDQNQQVQSALGECVIFRGSTVGISCTYAANVNEPGWLPNTSRTITLQLAAPASKGTKLSTCAQPKPFVLEDGCSPQDFDAAGGSSTAGGTAGGTPGPDLEVEVEGEHVIQIPQGATVRAHFTVRVTNRGRTRARASTLDVIATIRTSHGDQLYLRGQVVEISPACAAGAGEAAVTCRIPALGPDASRRYLVTLHVPRTNVVHANDRRSFVLRAKVTPGDSNDPAANNKDSFVTVPE